MSLSFRISPIRAVRAVQPWPGRNHYPQRIKSIDAARGIAMVFACLSHFSTAYLYPAGHFAATYVLTVISMVASPSFIILSGMVTGLTAVMCPHGFPQLRVHLIDRGLFLIIVGHFVLASAILPRGDV